ncbi:TonB-dependent receptor [Caulobacter sp. BP25]|uniref:TonB-dependent receptor n=1 Tax=Caulobacter sp. BP25 TaxID=2048900 RepID=UPI000C12D204|nr:TonB-dependent receptor [Caulobacter sp. BP25]PHY21534.1 TonB-dependent receptor [Caulobacter sp. BP25]
MNVLNPRALRAGAAYAALMAGMITAPAMAQVAAPAATPTTDVVEEIIVVGSRIQRKDADSVGVVTTLTEQDIRQSGAGSVGELLQKLPSAGVSLSTNGTQGTSYGASSINLRYLGGAEGSGNRVLVLVDGHRWVDGVGQRGFRDFVDLNTMPLGMIEGVEVLKDGASAIYGADAIAGVVNIKTARDFNGLKVQAKYGGTTHGDGQTYSGVANFGKRFDKSALLVSLSYVKDKPILTSSRDLTRVTLVPATSPGTSPNGLFILPGLSNNTYFGTASGFASSSAPVAFNAGATIGAGGLADNAFHTAALPGDYYNTQAQGIYSTGPSERYGVYARWTSDISDNVRFKGEVLFNQRKSDQLFSPVLLDIGGSAGTIRGFAIPASQAYNPFGTANGVPTANALTFAANSAWRIRKVMTDVGNRDNVQDVKTYRVAGGFDGELNLLGRDWKWDVYALYSKNKIDSEARNGVNYDKLALGLGAACATTAGCVPINLFSGMTAEQAAYIRYTARESNETEIYDLTANITGEVFQLPAGPLAIAAGLEHRKNKASDSPDPYVNALPTNIPTPAAGTAYASNTTTTAQTRSATKGQYSLNEVYVEAAIPLLKDVPLAKALDISLAARYSDYDTVGGDSTLKAGVGWRPIQDILVRGTYAQGFRAPSILELYQGGRQTSFQGTDPCNGGASANPNLPGCAGVPTGYNQANFNLNGLIAGTISGNTKLKAETADTYSAGVAIKPRFAPGLSLTVDWYQITVHDAIASQSATQILSLCAQRGGVFCNLVTRDPSTGAITNLLQGVQNLAEVKTSGVDSTLRYEFSTDLGRFAAVLDTSYLESFKTTSPNPAGGAAIVDERAGKGDQPRSTYPHWKGQASFSWTGGAWNALWRGRYIGSTTDVANAVKDAKTKAIFYNDLEGGYQFDKRDASISIGVSNIFDKAPPASYANAPINYDIYTYDARGRFGYVRVSAKF